jgi:hypothetical protein
VLYGNRYDVATGEYYRPLKKRCQQIDGRKEDIF